jgi:hypothetical protein
VWTTLMILYGDRQVKGSWWRLYNGSHHQNFGKFSRSIVRRQPSTFWPKFECEIVSVSHFTEDVPDWIFILALNALVMAPLTQILPNSVGPSYGVNHPHSGQTLSARSSQFRILQRMSWTEFLFWLSMLCMCNVFFVFIF